MDLRTYVYPLVTTPGWNRYKEVQSWLWIGRWKDIQENRSKSWNWIEETIEGIGLESNNDVSIKDSENLGSANERETYNLCIYRLHRYTEEKNG